MSYTPHLELGNWNAICDRCGFKFKADQLKHEWNGLIVCKRCWEPRHELDFLEGIKDDTTVPWQRPEQDDYYSATVERNSTNATFRELVISTPDSNVVATDSNVALASGGTNGSIDANTVTYTKPF